MTRYLLPIVLLATFAFAAPEARAEHPHHHRQHGGRAAVGVPGFGIGMTAGNLGYGVGMANYGLNYGYGGYGGYGYGGYAPVFAPYPVYGGYGYRGYVAPQAFSYPQSYFSSPNYGRWGAFGN